MNEEEQEIVEVKVTNLSRYIKLLLSVILLCTTVIVYINVRPVQYEYKVSFFPERQTGWEPPPSVVDELNKLGNDGWNIISTRRAQGDNSWGLEVIAQRRK